MMSTLTVRQVLAGLAFVIRVVTSVCSDAIGHPAAGESAEEFTCLHRRALPAKASDISPADVARIHNTFELSVFIFRL